MKIDVLVLCLGFLLLGCQSKSAGEEKVAAPVEKAETAEPMSHNAMMGSGMGMMDPEMMKSMQSCHGGGKEMKTCQAQMMSHCEEKMGKDHCQEMMKKMMKPKK